MSKDRLSQTFTALSSIGGRLRMSVDDPGFALPATSANVSMTDDAALKARDAFLQRFQQTTDHLLRRLFPRLLVAAEQKDDAVTFRETLERLCRLGVIDDVETWVTLARLRNRLTHEYALEPHELAQDLNTAWEMAPRLLDRIAAVGTFARYASSSAGDQP